MHEPLGMGLKLDEKLDHQGPKENKSTSATDLRDELGEVVELELKGSAFGITGKSWEYKSDALRVFARGLPIMMRPLKLFGPTAITMY
jgi:hypothetical protein